MVVEPNRTERRIGHHLLLDGFDARVVESPHAVAVIFEGEGLTYAEFDARVDAVAQRLVALGVVPETRVALAMRRSVELVIGMYAVLRAGGAYVPVDPDHPLDRVAYILDAADPLVVLTTHRDDFTATGDRLVLHLDDLDDTDRSGKPFDRPTVHPENSAYVIFTSGSTGKPKGVTVSHGASPTRWHGWSTSTPSTNRMSTCRRPPPPSTSRCGASSCRSEPAQCWSWRRRTVTAIPSTSRAPFASVE